MWWIELEATKWAARGERSSIFDRSVVVEQGIRRAKLAKQDTTRPEMGFFSVVNLYIH